jgi:hypothetical protein
LRKAAKDHLNADIWRGKVPERGSTFSRRIFSSANWRSPGSGPRAGCAGACAGLAGRAEIARAFLTQACRDRINPRDSRSIHRVA